MEQILGIIARNVVLRNLIVSFFVAAISAEAGAYICAVMQNAINGKCYDKKPLTFVSMAQVGTLLGAVAGVFLAIGRSFRVR